MKTRERRTLFRYGSGTEEVFGGFTSVTGPGPLMEKFYFDLVGDVAASDPIGHDCANAEEAREHGRFIAHRIGTEKPQMVRPGNHICVRDEGGYAIYRAPIATTAAAKH